MCAWFCDQLNVDEKTVPVFFGVYAFPEGLKNEEIEALKKTAMQYPQPIAKDGFGYNIENRRISCVKPIDHKDTNLSWLLDRLTNMAQHANTSMRWNFQLDGFHEKMQYASFEREVGIYYDGHYDVGKTPMLSSRKLTIHVQLSDPADYEGGQLELYQIGPTPRRKGLVVVFPSFLMYRISPIIKGTRESLTAWVSGTPFR